MNLRMMRQAVAENQTVVFDFERPFLRAIVKNLTEGNIYVQPLEEEGEEQTKEESILIPPQCSEIIFANEYGASIQFRQVSVIAEVTSDEGVEIRCTRW